MQGGDGEVSVPHHPVAESVPKADPGCPSKGGYLRFVCQAWRTARKRHSSGCGGPVATWGCAPFGVSPLRTLVTGTVSRTARVSGATRDLKEAAGKVPARRTGTAYEASTSGRGGKETRSPIVTREGVDVDAAGMWNEGRASYPGRSAVLPPPRRFWGATGAARCRDGTAEVSRGHNRRLDHPLKGRT